MTNGLAYFGFGNGCSISLPGKNYTLTATDTGDGLPAVTSTTFNVVGTATQLVFTGPTNTVVGTDFTPDVTVSVEDALGDVVTTANGNVTMAINPGSPAGTLQCQGVATPPCSSRA